MLAWRDVAVRYKQTLIGVAWALLRPLLTLAVFTVVFSKLARLPSEGDAPYALLVFAGMLPWYLFSSALGGMADSLVGNAHLIGKVYFPRLIVPVASVVTALIDFLVSLVLLAPLMAWYGYAPGWQALSLPFFVLLALAASLGPGLWFTALNVNYRDFRFVVPFVLQLGIYISPVGFSSAIVPEQWRLLYALNPMVGVIDGFRWCLLGTRSPFGNPAFYVSLAIVAWFLWFGLRRFRRTERNFADLI